MVRPRMRLLALGMLVGCGGGRGILTPLASAPLTAAAAKAADGPTDRPLLNPEDLVPGPGAAPPSAAERQRDGNEAVVTGFLGQVPGKAGDDSCLDRGLARLTVHVKGESAVVSGQLDLGSCLAASLADTGTEVLAAEETLRFYLQITCDAVDLARLDGQTYGDLVAAGVHPCAGAGGANVLVQTDDVQFARVRRQTPSGQVTAEAGRRHLQSDGGEGGGPCRFELKDGHFVRSKCTVVSRDLITRSRVERDGRVVTRPDEGRETYLRLGETLAN